MWDVVGGDFDKNCSEKQLIKNITENAVKGSIIVLHDNDIVKEKMLGALPKIIEILQNDGYTFKAIPFSPLR